MEVSIENIGTLGRKLKVTVPEIRVTDEIKTRMVKLSKEVQLKGFRQGKIPQKVLQERFGLSVRSEVINELIRTSLTDAIKEKDLKLAGMPTIDDVQDKAGAPLEFIANFEVYPTIKLAELSNVQIERRSAQITDEDVERMISKLKKQFSDWVEVERATQDDDRVTVDFVRKFGSDEAKEETNKGIDLILGSKTDLPGLSEGLLGKNKDDVVELDLTYPDTWKDKQSAGKKIHLSVTIHEIRERKILNDDELSEKLEVEKEPNKLREGVLNRMTKELEQTVREEIKEKILEILMEKNPLEIPKSLIDQELEAIENEVARKEKMGMGQDFSEEDIKGMAHKRVVLGLLVNEIITQKALKVDNQKVRAEVEKIASSFGKPADIVKAYYSNKNLLMSVERMVLLDQAVDAILDEMDVKEKTVTFDEVMETLKEND